MSNNYIQIPSYGSPSWKDPVATSADLPASGNSLGDARVTNDTQSIYIWSGSAWVEVSGGGGGSPGGSDGQLQYNAGGSFGGTGYTDGTNVTIASTNPPSRALSVDSSGNAYMSFMNSGSEQYVVGSEAGVRPWLIFDPNLSQYTMYADPSGNIGIQNNLSIVGTFTSDNGNITTDGSGDLSVQNLNVFSGSPASLSFTNNSGSGYITFNVGGFPSINIDTSGNTDFTGGKLLANALVIGSGYSSYPPITNGLAVEGDANIAGTLIANGNLDMSGGSGWIKNVSYVQTPFVYSTYFGAKVMDTNDGSLWNPSTHVKTMNFANYELYDSTSVISGNWSNRTLTATDGTTVGLDWSNPNGARINNPVIISDGTNNLTGWFAPTALGGYTLGLVNSFGQLSFGTSPPSDAIANFAGSTLTVQPVTSVGVSLDFSGTGYTEVSDGTVYSRTIYNSQVIGGTTVYDTGTDASYTEELNPGPGSLIAAIVYDPSGNFTANGSSWQYDIIETYNGQFANGDAGPSNTVTDDNSGNPYYVTLTWTPAGAGAQSNVAFIRLTDNTYQFIGADSGATADNNVNWVSYPGPSGTVTWNFDINWILPPLSNSTTLVDNTNTQYDILAQGVTSLVDDNTEWTAGAPTITPTSLVLNGLSVTGGTSLAGGLTVTGGETVTGGITMDSFASNGASNSNGLTNVGLLRSTASGSGNVPFIVKAYSGQSADLSEWQNSSGGILSGVDSFGNFTAPTFNPTAAQTTITGSAGTAVCSMPMRGSSYKKAIIYLNGYTNSGTQNYTFPTAFSHTPYVYGLTAGVAGATVSTTTISFTATTLTGFVMVEGY